MPSHGVPDCSHHCHGAGAHQRSEQGRCPRNGAFRPRRPRCVTATAPGAGSGTPSGVAEERRQFGEGPDRRVGSEAGRHGRGAAVEPHGPQASGLCGGHVVARRVADVQDRRRCAARALGGDGVDRRVGLGDALTVGVDVEREAVRADLIVSGRCCRCSRGRGSGPARAPPADRTRAPRRRTARRRRGDGRSTRC